MVLLATAGCSLTGGKWVARVNGQAISQTDFDQRVAASEALYKTQGMDFTSAQGKQAEAQLKNNILQRMVEGDVISQEVRKLGLSTNDSQVKQQEAGLKKNFGTEAKFQDALKQQGMTEPELLDFLALYQKVSTGVKVSASDVQNYFNAHKSQYGHPEEVEARHILVKTKAEAEQIISELNKDKGANFAQLAKEKSIDPGSKDKGGELGFFTQSQMDPGFAKAAFSQKVGTWSQTPVKSSYGYHVILVEAHKPAVTPDFNAEKTQVEQDALTGAKDAKFQTYMNALMKKATVDYAHGFAPAPTPAAPTPAPAK
ncbi:putative peptidyl-prolyl cis-trans isomerase Cbf2 precursor [Peptococcaceae bacterium CEB3]|nr:putative peptidyl-prolyl cis-trans isomerase Cbf2 precursor [Peptococcaceae bacterium CEB3]